MARRWTKLPNIFARTCISTPLSQTHPSAFAHSVVVFERISGRLNHFHLTAEVQSLPCCCRPYCTVTFISCVNLPQSPHEFAFTPPHCLFFYIWVIISYNATCFFKNTLIEIRHLDSWINYERCDTSFNITYYGSKQKR